VQELLEFYIETAIMGFNGDSVMISPPKERWIEPMSVFLQKQNYLNMIWNIKLNKQHYMKQSKTRDNNMRAVYSKDQWHKPHESNEPLSFMLLYVI